MHVAFNGMRRAGTRTISSLRLNLIQRTKVDARTGLEEQEEADKAVTEDAAGYLAADMAAQAAEADEKARAKRVRETKHQARTGQSS